MLAKMPTHWQVAYDIAQPQRLRRVERTLAAVGQRVHESLFTCELTSPELQALQRRVARCLNLREDVVRYMPLCAQDARHSSQVGDPIQAAHSQATAWII